MTQPIPGPYRVDEYHDADGSFAVYQHLADDQALVGDGAGKRIAQMPACREHETEQYRATAAMLAAAPEMLDTLRIVHNTLLEAVAGRRPANHASLIFEIEGAIARATVCPRTSGAKRVPSGHAAEWEDPFAA